MGVELSNRSPKIVRSVTYHGRYGEIKNKFKYNLDCILLPISEKCITETRLFSRNKNNIICLKDKDYGAGGTNAYNWLSGIAKDYNIDISDCTIWLFTQPRVLGYAFNPVSFWFFVNKKDNLIAVIAEVNNTFGDKHSYICFHDDFRPIAKDDRLQSRKVFHVSPFQEIEGQYTFRFYFSYNRIGVWIDYRRGEHDGLYASITGQCEIMSDWSLLRMFLRYPIGSLRVFALIHWQALKLAFKGAKYRDRTEPPVEEISR